MTIIAIRTDAELDRKLREAMREEKKTKTHIIREALHAYFEARPRRSAATAAKPRLTAADVLKDSLGVWDGPADSSKNVSRKVADYLYEKRRSRRA